MISVLGVHAPKLVKLDQDIGLEIVPIQVLNSMDQFVLDYQRNMKIVNHPYPALGMKGTTEVNIIAGSINDPIAQMTFFIVISAFHFKLLKIPIFGRSLGILVVIIYCLIAMFFSVLPP